MKLTDIPRIAKFTVAAWTISVGFAAVLPAVSASAATVNYQAVTTIAPPPPAQFQGTGGGDGWGLAFTKTQVFNVFHHQPTLQVECHLQVDASQCTTNNFPITITDNSADPFAGDNFAVSAQPAVWIDQNTGDLFVYATATPGDGSGTAGVVCVDTSSNAADPFCGFTPLSAVGDSPTQGGISMVSAGVIIGGNFYAFNFVSTQSDVPAADLGTTNTMMCFDLTTDSSCAGQPFALNYGSGNDNVDNFPNPAITVVGSDIIVPIRTDTDGALLTCFDTTAETTCSGSWPIADPQGYPTPAGAAIPVLDAAGNPLGFCERFVTACFDVTGSSIAVPSGFYAMPGLAAGSGWIGTPAVLGTRVIFAWVSGADCYDYSTGAECANYPITLPNYGFGYTMNLDPNRAGCIWGNANGGSGQIQNFDAYTTVACGAGGDRVTLSQFVPTSATCQPTSYTSLTILSPSPDLYSGGSVQFQDSSGNNLGSPVAIDSSGVADISALDFSAQTILPQALIVLPGAPSVAVEVQLTWQGSDALACDLVPEPPAPASASVVAAGLGQGNYTIDWTTPGSDGGTPITGYTVTALPGGASCATTTALTCDINGLADTTNYTFNVVATNAVGNSDPATTSPVGELPGPAVSTSPPTISGLLTVGDTMTATTGTWAVDQGLFVFQWYSCTDTPVTIPSVDANCTAVGVNSLTYVTQPTDGGNHIAVVVTDTGTDGSTTAAGSNVLGPITGPPLSSTPPVISGPPTVGQTLTSGTGSWLDTNGVYNYQWYSCTDSPAASPALDIHCASVGTNSSSYDIVAGDLGAFVIDVVTATGTDTTTASQFSNVLGPVADQVLNSTPPTISGSLIPGRTLNSTTGIWTHGIGDYAYQWYSCTDSPTASPASDTNCAAVGTDASSYVIVPGDLGNFIADVVTAAGTYAPASSAWSNVLGPVSAPVAAPVPVTVLPLSVTPPVISGALEAGQALDSTTGTWQYAVGSFSYQWYRCSDSPSANPATDSSCTAVGSNAASYALGTSDVSRFIVDVVTAKSTDGSTASAWSNVVGPVAGEPVVQHQPKPPAPFHMKVVVLFASDSTRLTNWDTTRLNRVVSEIIAHHISTVNLVGCTDRIGSASYNLKLSTARAVVVRDYLRVALSAKGAPPVKIIIAGVGIIVKFANLALDRRVDVTLGN